jgi:DNA helicase-2/ATP-dependent DNA helicase PcrA
MSEILKDANQEQLQAITYGDGPLLIVAGAGTGKTKVISSRIAWLIEEAKAKSEEILALTFTEKSAAEMQERVEKQLPLGYVDLWISTFHSFCDKILKRHAIDIGLPSDYRLLDQTQAWLLVKKNLDKFNLDYYQPVGNPTKFIHALINHFSRCKDEVIFPKNYLKYAEDLRLDTDSCEFIKTRKVDDIEVEEKSQLVKQEISRVAEIAAAYQVYQQLLIDNNALDFGDLINYCLELFRKRPLILAQYQKQFKYILVDEFQDTNFAQYELIKILAAPKNNLTVVGDDDQSIYKFRGASITNIMKFMEDYIDAKQIILIKNYRSSQEILDKAYEFIQKNNPDRLEVKLKIDKKLESQVDQPGKIEFSHYANYEQEAQGVIKAIKDLKDADKSCEYKDFAILVRANDSANIFISLLEKAGIPYQFIALKGLYHKTIILDVVNYFRLLDDYHENSATFRILNSRFLDIDALELAKISYYAKMKTWSLFEVLKQIELVSDLSAETKTKLNNLFVQIKKHTLAAKKTKTSQVFISFINDSGYLNFLQKLPDGQKAEEYGYLNQFMEKIQKFEETDPDGTISDFIELINLELEAGDNGALKFNPESGPELVKVMTVHSAKGLEFKYVFLVNLVDRKFPCDDRHEPISIPSALICENLPEGDFHLAEERRLFYVGMTRAKHGLFFTSANDYGGARQKKLSRFLLELNYEKPSEPLSFNIEKNFFVPTQKVVNAKYAPLVRYSFSSLSTYETCPYKFYLGYVMRVPVGKKSALVFGEIIHDTLREFAELKTKLNQQQQESLFQGDNHKSMESLNFKDLLKLYEKNWRDGFFENDKQKNRYFENGKIALKNFYEDYTKTNEKIHLLEQPFVIALNEEKISGRIDRIDLIDDGVEIIDYKTGQAPKKQLATKNKRQLILYQWAAQEKNILNLKPQKLTYFYLEANKKIHINVKDENVEKLKKHFEQLIEKIKNQEFLATPNQATCQFCDYRGICEYRKI